MCWWNNYPSYWSRPGNPHHRSGGATAHRQPCWLQGEGAGTSEDLRKQICPRTWNLWIIHCFLLRCYLGINADSHFFPSVFFFLCSWRCLAPCQNIWMYIISVSQHPGFSFSPCTGLAPSLPSQLSGKIVEVKQNKHTVTTVKRDDFYVSHDSFKISHELRN